MPNAYPPQLDDEHLDEAEDAGGLFLFRETALLKAERSAGGHKFWKAQVLIDDPATGQPQAFTRSVYWTTSKDGSKNTVQRSSLTEIEGKNKGRSNETTPVEQAVSEAESKADKKKDKMYWPASEEKPEFLTMPMTAKTYAKIEGGEIKRKHADKIEWPAAVQPKLDGVRMLFDGEKGWTRKLKTYIPEVIQHLTADLPDGVVLDGELMLPHAKYTFQETISAVKKYQPGLSPELRFFVYDLYDKSEPKRGFEGRHNRLLALSLGQAIELVPTIDAHSERELLALHASYIDDGYEGAMVRNWDGAYKAKTTRSKHLQKLKGFDDDEFEIVAVDEAKGGHKGTALFYARSHFHEGADLELPSPEEILQMGASDLIRYGIFTCHPNGTHEARTEMYDRREELIGKDLTVRYQGLTDDKAPRFPRGIAVRDYE